VDFQILGPLEVADGARPVELTGGKQRALLALLLLHAGRVVPVERLVDDLWGEEVPDSARKMIQIFVSQLRKQLPPGLIQTRPPGYLCALDGHSLDLHRLATLQARGREAFASGRADEAAAALGAALDLWRGPPLAEFPEPFARHEEARLEEERLACLEERIDAELQLGRHADLVGELDALVRRHPLRERFRGQQMLALYRGVRHAEALEAFQRFRRTLRDELGIEPSARLKELERRMLQQDASLDVETPEPSSAKPNLVPEFEAILPESRRTVTVLVADVAPREAPDDAEARRAFVHEQLREAGRELERHGASVVPLGGTRLLAAFGVPAAQDDDALRAVQSAVALRALAPTARIGVASGEVVTGDPLVAGAPVDEATRLQEAAAPGEVAAATRTWRVVRHAAVAESRDGAWLIETVDSSAAPFVRHLETPLVGREQELREIVRSFERAAAAGRPHLVTVFGAPGIGKTRLGLEAVEQLRTRMRSVVAHCHAGEQEATFAPLRDALAGLADGDVVAWLRERLGRDDGLHIAEQLATATGFAPGSAHAVDVTLAIRRLLVGLAREQPLLLVLDDVHWAAPAPLDLVESLVELSQAPLLVLCLARPDLLDVRPQWGGGRLSSKTIMLDALTHDESHTLLERLASESPLDAVERDRILALADGNPLFLEQLLAAALDGALDTLPDSIQTLLAGRLDRLDALDRAVVEAASVCGTSFSADDAARLLGRDVMPSLVTLVRRELIRPDEIEEGWSFRHVIIRDAAYASIPKRRRAELHRALAALILERAPDGDVLAAFHLDQALRALVDAGATGPDVETLTTAAAEQLRRAGLAAADRDDYAAAASLLMRANELLPRTAVERLELLPKLGDMKLWVGGPAVARALLDEALAIAMEIGDERLAARARITTDLSMMWTEPPVPTEQMLRDVEDAVPIFERTGDDEALALAELLRFHALDQAGLPGPEERLPVALAHARAARVPHIEQQMMSWICITLPRGTLTVDAAIEHVEEIMRSSPSAYVQASACGALGLMRAERGEFTEARALVRRTQRELEELDLRQAVAAHSIAIAEVEMLAGDDGAAEPVLRRGFDQVTDLGDRHSRANVAWRLGLVLARQGKDDEAERFARLAEQARPRGLWVDVWWRVVLALVEAHRGRAAETAALVADARGLIAATTAAESRMEADALLESADALRAAGLQQEATELFADAAGIADRLGYVVALERAREAQRTLTT